MADNGSIDIVINAMTEKFNKNMKSLQDTVNSSASKISGLGKAVIGLGAAYAGISGIKSFAEDIMKTRMEYEKMEAALSATVGAANMDKVFSSLQQFAKDTPFTLAQVTESYQRLVNLGLDPSKKAMLAYGNIAAGIPNKSITDFIEAVADAVTGENERLKEFGIQSSKSGEMVSYTFQGVTKTFKGTKENIEQYLQAVGASFANGQALSNQALTMSGRLSALGDTFDQLKNNMAKSSGASKLFGEAIESITGFVQDLSDLFESDAISSYVDAFKTSMQPVIDLFSALKDLATGTDLEHYFDGPTQSVQNFFDEISELWSKVMDVVAIFTEMANNGTLTEIWEEAKLVLKPFWDMIVDFLSFMKNIFVKSFEDVKTGLKQIWDNTSDIIKKPILNAINYIKSMFADKDGNVTGESLVEKMKYFFFRIPAYIKKALYDALAEFKYFKDVAISYVSAIITTIKEFSTDAGAKVLDSSLADASKTLKDRLKDNQKEFDETSRKIEEANARIKKSTEEATKAAEEKRNKQKAQIAMDRKEAQNKLDILHKQQQENKGKDVAGDVGKQIVADQMKNAKGQSTLPTKKSGSGSKENSEYKKVLDGQIKLEEDRYKQGEISAKEYYANLLQLKLAQLGKENSATSEAFKKNLEIINSSSSTEDQKKKAIQDNIDLQKSMNSGTEQEKNLRAEINNQLRDANKEFLNNMQSLQSALNDAMDGSKLDDTMNSFEEKYGLMRKRIAAEDAANGTNFLPKLDQLQSITKATAEIAEQQRQLNDLQAEYDARTAEINYQVSAGIISSTEGKKQEIELTKNLTNERVKYLENELNIAKATPGYSEVQTAGIRKQLAEYQQAQVSMGETGQNIAKGISSSFTSAFSDIVDGTKSFGDIMKDLFSNIANSIVSTLTSGWADTIVGSLLGAGGKGKTSGGSGVNLGGSGLGEAIGNSDWFSKAGDWISGYFATGGVMKPNTYNVVGENGPEVVYSGSRPTSVMNNAGYNKLNSNNGGSTIVNMNVTTKDANSMRQSTKQLMLETQKEANRQINRNT